MGKNNNLDMQTFQIYQDEETDAAHTEKMEAPKKKKFSMSSLFKKEKAAGELNEVADSKEDYRAVKTDDEKVEKRGMSDALKGVLIGVAVLLLIVAFDQLL
jgi:hypothetical protein